jgi:hypothetical protein
MGDVRLLKHAEDIGSVRFLLLAIAGWMNQQQQHAIEYLREENRVLRAQLGGRRLRLTDDQRRNLAVKARLLGRKMLAEIQRPRCAALRMFRTNGQPVSAAKPPNARVLRALHSGPEIASYHDEGIIMPSNRFEDSHNARGGSTFYEYDRKTRKISGA